MIDKVHIIAKYLDRGPGKIVSTLRQGIQRLGIRETSFDDAEHIACLQWGDTWPDVSKFSGKRALIGPNTWESPNDRPEVVSKLHNFIAPSEWVRQKHLTESILDDKEVHVWSGGIEADTWVPASCRKDIDCLVYIKNREQQEYDKLAHIMTQLSTTIKSAVVFEYGHYDDVSLLKAAQRSKFAILLTNTESQGYAYMQLLSTNLPCLVFDKDVLVSRDGSQSWPATSAPYFDDRCGKIVKDISADEISSFLDMGSCWSPRDYILENHTIEASTQKYLQLLSEAKVL